MEHFEVIVVGGGPAGSSCARELARSGRSAAILDRADFPRDKLCAGWIPPSLFRRLGVSPEDYPGGLREYRRLHFRIKGVPVPVPTRQYAIRRYEFDFYLLQSSGAPFYHHHVHKIERIDGGHAAARFRIDDRFTCRYLVGAGGTGCPVAAWQRARGGIQRKREELIVTLESEFYRGEHGAGARRDSCYLRFFDRGLVGYSWYLPKADGYLTIGTGGKQAELRRRGQTIRDHWQPFVQHLEHTGLLEGSLPDPHGHSYYLRSGDLKAQECRATPQGHLYLIGDAAGFATMDMGEGIEPAVHSGQLAARAIIEEQPLRVDAVKRRSLPDILRPGPAD